MARTSYGQYITSLKEAIEANQLTENMRVFKYETICIAIEYASPAHFRNVMDYVWQHAPIRDYTHFLQRRQQHDEQINSTNHVFVQAYLYYRLYTPYIWEVLGSQFVRMRDPTWLNIALYISISRGDVAHVAEYLALINYFKVQVAQFNPFTKQSLLESVEKPLFRANSYFYFEDDSQEDDNPFKITTNDKFWASENFDRNDVTDVETRDARIAIMKSLLDLGPLTINVDESGFSQGFDILMNEDVDIDEYFRENDAAFLFIQQVSPTITFNRLITREDLLRDIYNWDTRTRHCLMPDSKVGTNGAKTMDINEVGLQPIIKIAHQQGIWCVYLKSLENLYNRYKSAIVYLKPACKTIWRISERNARCTDDVFGMRQNTPVSIASFFATEHCQEGVVEWIYALQVCGGEKCVKSEKLSTGRSQNFDQLYLRDLDTLIDTLQQEYDSQRRPSAPSFAQISAFNVYINNEDEETMDNEDEINVNDNTSTEAATSEEELSDEEEDIVTDITLINPQEVLIVPQNTNELEEIEQAMIADLLDLPEQVLPVSTGRHTVSDLVAMLRGTTNEFGNLDRPTEDTSDEEGV